MARSATLFLVVLAICGMLAAAQHGHSNRGGRFNSGVGKLHGGVGKLHGGVGKLHGGIGKIHGGRKFNNVGLHKTGFSPIGFGSGFGKNIDYGFHLKNYKGIDYKYICKLQYDAGYGKWDYERYYYDVYSKSCKPFYYKGYGGNGNNFYSYKECVKYCKAY